MCPGNGPGNPRPCLAPGPLAASLSLRAFAEMSCPPTFLRAWPIVRSGSAGVLPRFRISQSRPHARFGGVVAPHYRRRCDPRTRTGQRQAGRRAGENRRAARIKDKRRGPRRGTPTGTQTRTTATDYLQEQTGEDSAIALGEGRHQRGHTYTKAGREEKWGDGRTRMYWRARRQSAGQAGAPTAWAPD